jgi:polar amino acid transport system substrate-binding protein
MSHSRLLAVLALVPVLALAACGEPKDDASSSTATKTTAAASAQTCTKDQLALQADGKLTIGTDKPAYPPYFEDDDPTNGKGFESAVGYAVAAKLGFDKSEVTWKTVPFNSSYAPGRKTFDFDLNQVSISDARQKAVDFSSPYFEAPQAVVVPKGSELTDATLAGLKDARLGVQIGTTSLAAVKESIAPKDEPKVFDTSNDVVTALKQKQVDHDRVLPDGRAGRGLVDPRPVRGLGRRPLGCGAREGLEAHPLRHLGRGRAPQGRGAGADHRPLAQRGRRRPDAALDAKGRGATGRVVDDAAGPEAARPGRRGRVDPGHGRG